ncbi:MAG TPA: MFS transporter [Steroidobacteraceae bacterium]|nr:MFS transporter [Steroidobacteraceae bacterium]
MRPRLVVLLSMIGAFLPLVTDGFLTAIRPMMTELGVGVGGGQLATSVALAGFAAAQLVVGALADRYGRRPVLLTAIGLLMVASVGVGTASSFGTLLAFRFLQGVAAAAGPVLSRTVVRDLCARVEGARVLSLVAMGLAVVPLAVPAVNAVVAARFGWRATLVTYVVYLAAALAATIAWYRETLAVRDPRALSPGQMGAAALAILRHPPALGYTLCCVFGYGGLVTWISAAPHLLYGYFSVPLGQFGLYWAIPVITYAIGAYASAHALSRYSTDAILTAGAAALLLGGGTLLALEEWNTLTLAGFMTGVAIYNFGWSVVQPHAQAAVLAVQPDRAGRVSAILGFLQMLGGAGIGLLFGVLHDGSPRAAVGLIVASALSVTVVRVLLISRHTTDASA